MSRPFLLVLPFIFAATAAQAATPAESAAKRAARLIVEVSQDGLQAVINRATDPLGLPLLEMIADLTGDRMVL